MKTPKYLIPKAIATSMAVLVLCFSACNQNYSEKEQVMQDSLQQGDMKSEHDRTNYTDGAAGNAFYDSNTISGGGGQHDTTSGHNSGRGIAPTPDNARTPN